MTRVWPRRYRHFDGRQSVQIRQRSRVENQQNAVHIAETLVVFVNKLTLRTPFHCALLDGWTWSMGPAEQCCVSIPQACKSTPKRSEKQCFYNMRLKIPLF